MPHGANVCIHFHRSVGEAEQLRDELNASRAGSAPSLASEICSTWRFPASYRRSHGFGRWTC